MTPGRVAFGLAPRINAAGRVDDATVAVRLMLTTDPFEARELASQLDQRNRERQELEGQILEEALAQAAATHDLARDRAIVAGLAGLASRRPRDRGGAPGGAVRPAGGADRDAGQSGAGVRPGCRGLARGRCARPVRRPS